MRLDYRDHPRMCGEHLDAGSEQKPCPGSSPHVRGAHCLAIFTHDGWGIIPACAGSTLERQRENTLHGDHPRMCGEHLVGEFLAKTNEGSSPHVRGAPAEKRFAWCTTRIIPACAGSTMRGHDLVVPLRDHPRMCGEHSFNIQHFAGEQGSSPHVRGARSTREQERPCCGIIPACAGSTLRK